MRRHLILTSVLLFAAMAAGAKTPKWVKSNRNAVCQIIAYNAEGKETGRTTGFLIDKDGTGITGYELFSEAASAVCIDPKGVTRNILYITGANRIYDVVKFKVIPDRQMVTLRMAETSAVQGEQLYMLPYSQEKSIQPATFTVGKTSGMADGYTYYTLSGDMQAGADGCPLLNADGFVVGIMQHSIDTDTCNYAADSRYAGSLAISSALTMNDDNYRSLAFPKALPDTEEQALVYLYMNQAGDSITYSKLIDRFIAQYPDSPDGYMKKGSFLIYGTDTTKYDEGIANLDKAVAISEKKDATLYEYAMLIYTTLTSAPKTRINGWTLDTALDKISQAVQISREPAYLQLQGNILYSLEKFPEALSCYQELNKSSIASPETYYYTSVIKGRMELEPDDIIATLDSAVNFYGRPYTSKVAPFILERATTKENLERYRDAVLDLNEYEQIIGLAGLSAEFYYYREQIEIKGRMYEQALKDIDRAVYLSPEDLGLILEKASLLLRVGMVEDATPIMKELVGNNPDNTDCLRLYGICLMRSGKNSEARPLFQKAAELGDDLAEQLLKQMDK